MSEAKNAIDTQELYSTSQEERARCSFTKHFRECPIPDRDILQNLGLFLSSKNLSRILFMDFIYQKIVALQGVVMEFGCRWGQNVSLFSALRGIYEPFNRMRKIIAFDTFTGFPSIDENNDNPHDFMKEQGLACTENYTAYLDAVLKYQEDDNPMAHIKRYDIRAGDGVVKLQEYLKEFPETIISLAYFDFDIYEPTKKCLEMILPYLGKGSLLGFDELNDHDSPGETLALKEVLGLSNIKIQRFPYTSRVSYVIME